MSKWGCSERPRGVFLFGGPTGVGKTETAVQLAQMLSGSANNLIRVDCNTLQPTGHQKTSVIWTLLGVPPGYMGHGEGGILSKVREKPNAVILFDEFEKADAAVGKLLLQILDTGLQQDNMGPCWTSVNPSSFSHPTWVAITKKHHLNWVLGTLKRKARKFQLSKKTNCEVNFE